MSSNSERFISAFNKIDKFLNPKEETGKYVPFVNSVISISEHNIIVRRYKTDLLEFADLRNAIVHERTNPNFIIAEPHESTVEKIEHIEAEILNPKKVIPAYSREVESFQTTDSLAIALKAMREKSYSQFPIYKGDSFKGLLTSNGIANWLARNVEEDLVSILDTTIENVLECEEVQDNYRFISRAATIYEAEEIFKESNNKGSRIEALLITHSAKSDQGLLGIITTWDII